MGAQFRATGIYVNNKKLAEVQESSIKFMVNGEQITGFADVLGETTGIVTSEGSFTIASPVAGTEVDCYSLLLDQKYFQIAGFLNGGIYKIEAKFIDVENKSTSKSGVVADTFNWRGGAPKAI